MSDSDDIFENSCFSPRQVLWAIIVLAAVVRLWMAFTAEGINSDAWRYALSAEKMAKEGLLAGMRGDFLWPYYPLNRNLILYPLLGGFLLPFTGDAILSLRLVSAAAGIALVPLSYAITKRLFDREGIALVAGLLLAVHSEFARASAAVYREVFTAFVLALAFYLVLRATEDRRNMFGWAVASGLVLFLAFVTRPETIVAAPACGTVVLFWGSPLSWEKRLASCMVMALTFFMLEIPYVLWMKKHSGYWVTNQWEITRKLDQRECLERRLRKDIGEGP